jgi:tetratricopeptide (TPR) repeat protein
MKLIKAARITLLSTAIALSLGGCGDEATEMTQQEIQYISHLDQARFYQRQGELKASTLEARSAIELQPEKADPYFVILQNLLKAGDAENAERQLNQLTKAMADNGTEISPANQNQASLIRAEADFYQQKFDDALAALNAASFTDRSRKLDGKLLEGKIYHAQGQFDKARAAFEDAKVIDTSSALPLIGLSRLAFTENNQADTTKFLKEAEETDPAEPQLWLWKAQLAQANEQWEKSEEAYIRALDDIGQFDVMTRQKYETISALITVLRAQGKSSEAYVYEEILAKSGPGMVRSNLIASQEAYNQGDLDTAARYLEEVLRQAPSHEQSALMLGMIRMRQGRVEEAEKLLAPVVKATDSEEASKLLAATKLQMRDPEGAKSILSNLENANSDPSTIALAGIAALASGDQKSGEALIEKSLQQQPDNHELRLRYARYLIQAEKYDQAIANARKVIESSPETESAHIVLIEAYVKSGHPDKAVAAADQWIKDRPESMGAVLARGQLALQNGNPDEAKSYFTRASNAFADSPTPLIALGNLALTQDQKEPARRHFRKALDMAPDNRQAIVGYSNASSREDTIKLMNELTANHPDAIGPKLLLLENALTEGDSATADKLTAQLLERKAEDTPSAAEPTVIKIYGAVATQFRDNAQDKAGKILNRARVLFPENEQIALQAADLAFRSGDPNAARKIIQEAKKLHPDSANPYLIEAAYYERQKEYQQASELYELALNKQKNAGTEAAYIRALKNAGRVDGAIKAADAAVEAYPTNQPILMTAAMLYQGAEQNAKAQSAYEALLKQSPKNILALNNLAWLYHQNGDKRAMDLARKAYELKPDNAAIADTYGWILFQAGKQAESIKVLEKAHQLAPGSYEIGMHLVEAYRKAGNDKQAKAILSKLDANAGGKDS